MSEFTGQLGIDAKVSDNILVGVGYSHTEADIDFNLKQQEKLDVFSQSSIVYPYLGLKVDEWDAQFRATTGYGQMSLRVENSENITDERIVNLILTDFSTRKQLYSDTEIGENSSKSLTITGDTSIVRAIDEEGQELGYNTQIGLMAAKLAAEGSYKIEFLSGSIWHQLFSIGAYNQSKNAEQVIGLELKSESEIKFPHGVKLKNHGLLEFLNSESTADWYLGGSLDINENSDGTGINIGFSALLDKNQKYGFSSNWQNGSIFNLSDQNTDEIDFNVNSTIGYGIKVFDEAAMITPFTDFSITNDYSNKFSVGTQFKIGSDLDLEFAVNQNLDSQNNLDHDYQVKGSVRW